MNERNVKMEMLKNSNHVRCVRIAYEIRETLTVNINELKEKLWWVMRREEREDTIKSLQAYEKVLTQLDKDMLW